MTNEQGPASVAQPESSVRLVMREYEANVVVAEKTVVADRVVALELREVGGHELPEWEPGAHIDLILSPGLVRQYSLCGDSGDRHSWRVAVLRESDEQTRGGSFFVHDSIAAGTVLRMRGPRNRFELVPSPNYLFIAGGIGITPLLPMVAQVAKTAATWKLIYGGRRLASMAFIDELSGYGNQVELWPEDTRGLIDLGSLLGIPKPNTVIYCCGPQSLLAAVEAQCALWPSGSLRTELFSTESDANEQFINTAFEVVLSQQDVTLTVPPDKSVLEIIEESGVTVWSSCRAGMCGTCEATVLEGLPEHRDMVLTPEERDRNDSMMLCVSRCRGDRLVLDI